MMFRLTTFFLFRCRIALCFSFSCALFDDTWQIWAVNILHNCSAFSRLQQLSTKRSSLLTSLTGVKQPTAKRSHHVIEHFIAFLKHAQFWCEPTLNHYHFTLHTRTDFVFLSHRSSLLLFRKKELTKHFKPNGFSKSYGLCFRCQIW